MTLQGLACLLWSSGGTGVSAGILLLLLHVCLALESSFLKLPCCLLWDGRFGQVSQSQPSQPQVGGGIESLSLLGTGLEPNIALFGRVFVNTLNLPFACFQAIFSTFPSSTAPLNG